MNRQKFGDRNDDQTELKLNLNSCVCKFSCKRYVVNKAIIENNVISMRAIGVYMKNDINLRNWVNKIKIIKLSNFSKTRRILQ